MKEPRLMVQAPARGIHAGPGRAAEAPFLARLARRGVLVRMQRLEVGELIFVEDGAENRFGHPREDRLQASIFVHHPAAWSAFAFRGSVGAGEAYMKGLWSCDDLVSLVRILVLNRSVLEGMERGPARLSAPLLKAFHLLRRNTRRGSRRNIAAHYDAGNDFFALFLDETLSYSCGIFPRPDSTLLEASREKIDRACRKLDLRPSDHLLEIGTGWGALAIHAARTYGCRVTTATLSREQHDLAARRIREAGLSDRITLLLADYRDLAGSYDKLISIEMIEAVGHENLPVFFRTCNRLLKPAGMMLLQSIIMSDHYYEPYRRSVDFIQRYIFPGSCLPSLGALQSAIVRTTDMRLFHLEEIGPHYARTLQAWRESFRSNLDRIRALGHGDEFLRMWEFYFCYCEGGFRERLIGDVQMLLTRPGCRREPWSGC